MNKNLNFYKNLRAYRHLSFFNIVNHILCNSLLKNQYIASSFPSIYKGTTQIFSATITNFVLKHTFCKVFTVGSSLQTLKQNTQYLVKQRIPRVLVYCGTTVDSDENSKQLDKNASKFKEAALQASQHHEDIISIKISSLINAKLLKKYNKSVELRDRIWQDYSKNGVINAQSLFIAFQNIYSGVTDQDMLRYVKNIHNFDNENISEFQITQFDFKSNHQPYYLYQTQKNNELLINILLPLDNNQKQQISQMHNRIHLIIQGPYYKQSNLKVIIEGEQSFYLKAIQSIQQQLQNRYNKQKPYIFTTNQSYIINATKILDYQLFLARRNNIYFAINLVKGQHLFQQQTLCKQQNYQSQIVNTYQQLSDNYLGSFQTILKSNLKGQVFATSNNEITIQSLLQTKTKCASQIKVNFIQSCGIGEHLSNNLKDQRQNVYKTTPYGQADVTVPLIVSKIYKLSRGKLGYSTRLALLKKELSYRLFSQ